MCEPGTLYTRSTPSSRKASATASPACMGVRSTLIPDTAGGRLSRLAQRAQLPRDERLQHFVRAVSLRTGVLDPHVLAALEDLALAFPARRAVVLGELVGDLPRHVGVELALHDEERREAHLLAALEDLGRVALEDRLPRVEVHLALLHHVGPVRLHHVLVA